MKQRTQPSKLPDLREDQALSSESLKAPAEPSVGPGGADPVSLKKVHSGCFSGAGDSGVWPCQTPAATIPAAFISPMTIVFIIVWYVTGALTNSTSKQTLQQFEGAKKPFLSLTLMQHLMAG